MKEIWCAVFEEAYDEAIEQGMSVDDANVYASEYADENYMDSFIGNN